MNNDLRQQITYKLIKIHKLGRVGADFDDKETDELITIIRTAALDEVDEAIYREQPYTPAEATKVIDNLRCVE